MDAAPDIRVRPPEQRLRLPFGLSWEKLIIWTLFAGIVYSLRNFFDIVFMTFIMSYLAQRLVGRLTRALTGNRDHWLRRPILVFVYVAALGLLYLSGKYLLPRAVDQGRWLLVQVNTLNLDRIRDQILSSTLGRIELARFKRSGQYTPSLQAFLQEKASVPSLEQFRQVSTQIRETFLAELATKEGRRALEELKQAGRFPDLYREWVRENRAERELAQRPELRERLGSEFDAAWRRIYDEESFQRERNTPTYLELRQAKVLQNAADELVNEGRYRDEAEIQLGRRLGEERVRSMSAEEIERQFQDFYAAEVPRRWSGFPFAYEKFLDLEAAGTEEAFRQKLGAEASDPDTLQEKFDAWMELRLAKEHPWAAPLADTSQLVRDYLPRITAWLTNAINNAIRFGLDILLSMMFSAMIVWEVPRMRRALGRVSGTRAEPIYLEISPGVYHLGRVIGTAFSAQALVALLNALFTFSALQLLGVPSPHFLALFVFFFSLVPYVGIIVASVPILIVALQTGGLEMGAYAALAMFVIHELEAWYLSPKILGDILHLNPIVVIVVLFVGQELFGIWGLLLSVPVAVFLINDVALQPANSRLRIPTLPAAAEPPPEPEPPPDEPPVV